MYICIYIYIFIYLSMYIYIYINICVCVCSRLASHHRTSYLASQPASESQPATARVSQSMPSALPSLQPASRQERQPQPAT